MQQQGNVKRVLIAHQSTISHYRVSFYNALERLRPDWWSFDVVFDPSEVKSRRIYQETPDIHQFNFPILETRTFFVRIAGKKIAAQTFWPKAAKYDLVIVEYVVFNLVYPLCQLYQLTGTRFAYWGHDRDRSVKRPSLPKRLLERLKVLSASKADGFFAYTPGVKASLTRQGVSPQKVFVVNNTIDIKKQRDVFNQFRSKRETIRKELGLQGKKVLLFVGRVTKRRRIDCLLEAFSLLQERDPSFYLLLVGSGGESYRDERLENVSWLGPIVDLERLGPIYVASDLFAFPGDVGLGPLQALCYDLPVVTIESKTHGPEIEYLSPANSVILPPSTTPKDYAQAIAELFDAPDRLKSLRENIWSSIEHLTIERMVQNFITGVNSILDA